MRYEPGRGYRTEGDRSKDGFVDHAARRGAEKGAGCLAWLIAIFLIMVVVGSLLHAAHAL